MDSRRRVHKIGAEWITVSDSVISVTAPNGDKWNVARRPRGGCGDKPWIGGRASGTGATFRSATLQAMLDTIALVGRGE